MNKGYLLSTNNNSSKNSTLAVYVCYFVDGLIHLCDEYLIKQLYDYSSRLIIVVNGDIDSHSLGKLSCYTKEIILRPNRGFDAGAYKEVLFNCLSIKELMIYDRLILCNSSFLGFITPIDVIVSEMKLKYDFWGINYMPSGCWSHIQSYFLVFEKNIVKNADVIYDFFSKIDENNLYFEYAFMRFEVGIYRFFEEHGYRCGTYINLGQKCDIYEHPLEAIETYGFPIIKKKALLKVELECEVGVIGDYIKNNVPLFASAYEDYSNYIKELPEKRKDYKKIHSKTYRIDVSHESVCRFVDKNDYIYLYGAGVYGRLMYFFLEERINKIRGFVVSDMSGQDDNWNGIKCKEYVDLSTQDPVIICMDKDKSEFLYEKLKYRDKTLWLWQDMNEKIF